MKNLLFSVLFLNLLFAYGQSTEAIANFEGKNRNLSLLNPTFDRSQNPTQIDVSQYDLYFDFDSNFASFEGKSVVYATVLEETSQIRLDAGTNLNVSSVLDQNNQELDFNHDGNNLYVNFSNTLSVGQSVKIQVTYICYVFSSDAMFRETHAGEIVLTTLSEPFGSSSWWIGKNDLKDKADTVNIYATHPEDFKLGSNGTLMGIEVLENGKYQTHWQTNYPIPAYLISLAISNYEEYSNTANVSGTVVPVINYVYPENLNTETMAQLDAVPSYIEFFSGLVGDYPYKNEKYGHSQWNWGGGMEHATMSSQVNFETSLTAHELAHQWFGDKITCGTWSDIWLNEGFATYFEGLLRRNLYGEDFFTEWKMNRAYYVMSESGGSVYIPAEDAVTDGRIFDGRLSYYKGAMVVHMLRYTLGDEAFYQALQNYLNDPDLAYGFAVTEQLKSHLEAVSELELDEFFNDWVYAEGFPIYYVNGNYDQFEDKLDLNIEQYSSMEDERLFETKMSVLLSGTNGQQEVRDFYITESNQNVEITNIPFTLESYTLNPYFDVLGYVASETLGTDDLTNPVAAKVLIYPNPAVDFVYIESPEIIKNVQIFDLNGKIIRSKEVNDKALDLFVKDLPSTSYILKLNSENGVYTEKIIKK